MNDRRRAILKVGAASAISIAMPSRSLAQATSTTNGGQTQRYAAEVLEDGKHALARGLLNENDARSLLELANPKSPYHVYLALLGSANWHTRLGFYHLLAEQPRLSGVRHGWSLSLLAALFREREFVAAANEYKTLQRYRENVTHAMPYDLWNETFALCGRFTLGLQEGLMQLAGMFDAYDVRREFEIFTDEQTHRFPFELVRFLSIERPTNRDVLTLDKTFPLKGIAAAWRDDTAFAAITERWCQWHFDYSEQRRDRIWGLAVSPHDFLFPSWVFALDRCRQNVLGRSALGRHDLITYGKLLLSAIASESLSPPPVLVTAQKKYHDLFGSDLYDFPGFWRKFAG